ncbi:Caprin member 2 [Mactra antiquata]
MNVLAMTKYTKILIGLSLILIQDSCISAAGLDFTSQLSNDPVFQQVINRLNMLEDENKVQQQQIEKLEASNIFRQKIIQSLEQNVEELKQEIEEMKTTTTQVEPEEDDSITSSVDSSIVINGDFNVHDNGNEINDASNRISRQQVEIGNVAFTVILTKRLTNLGLNQNVIFNEVETNIGNAYNSHHGVFLAPLAGTYVFHVTIFATSNEETWCKIVVNGNNKVDVYAYSNVGHSDTGSQSLVVHLNQGDDVAIQNGRAGDNVYGDYNTWTTFSGFLLRSDAEVTGSNVIG